MRFIRYALFALSVWLAIPAMAIPRYVVATGGASSGSCLTTGTACTLTYALATTTSACGDSLELQPGVYTIAVAFPNRLCTEALPYVVRSSVGAIYTRSTSTTGSRFALSSGRTVTGTQINWHTIQGIYITATTARTIEFTGNNRGGSPYGLHNTIKDVTIDTPLVQASCAPGCGQLTGADYPIYAPDQDYLTIDGVSAGKAPRGTCNMCEETTGFGIPNSRFLAIRNTETFGYRTNMMLQNGEDMTLEDNQFRDLHNHGIGLIDVTRGLIQRNSWHYTNNDRGIEDMLWILCSHDLNVRNNLVYGYKPGAAANTHGPTQAFMGTHDSGCNHTGNADSIGSNWAQTINLTMANNIFVAVQGDQGASFGRAFSASVSSAIGQPLLLDYNMYWDNRYIANGGGTDYTTLTGWRAAAFMCPSGPCQDINSRDDLQPTFVDTVLPGVNFQPLNALSPQVDRGDDSNCANTIVGSHCDIGPYEFQGGTPAGPRDLVVTNCTTDGAVGTSGDLDWAIAQVNALPATGPASITFACAAGSVMQVTATDFNNRQITQPSTTINGGGNMTFEMTPKWWDLDPPGADTSLCASGDCDTNGDNIPEQCPTVNDGTTSMWLFRIQGAGSTLRNFTYRYFMEGIRAEAANWTVDTVVGEYPGDEHLSNPVTFDGTVEDSTFRNACDKGIQVYGDNSAGGAPTLGSFDMRILRNTFQNSSSAIRMSGTAGRYYIEGNTFEESSPPSTLFNDQGPYIGDDASAQAPIVYWKDNIVRATRRGLRLTGATQFRSLGGNTFVNNTRRGVSVHGTARAIFQNDTFTTNGLTGASTTDPVAVSGGIGVGQTALVDAGGRPTGLSVDGTTWTGASGGNTFSGNVFFSTSVHSDFNNVGSLAQYATGNCWTTPAPGHTADILNSGGGTVTSNPTGTCGSQTTSTTLRGASVSGTIR